MLASRLLAQRCGAAASAGLGRRFLHTTNGTSTRVGGRDKLWLLAIRPRTISQVRAYTQQPVMGAVQSTGRQRLWQLVGAGAVIGLGVVALDGLRAKNEAGAYPNYVAQRISATYGYVLGGLGMSAGFATYIARSPSMYYRLAAVNPIVMMIGTIAGTMGSIAVIRMSDNKVLQHAAWVTFTGFMGATLFPAATLAGNVLMRAAMGTAAVVGSISLVAATSRSDAHLAMAGPLSLGLGVVVACSLGQLFLPASTFLSNVVLYGGLAVFGGLTFFDTQRMIHKAKAQPQFDPLRQSIGIYLNIINIFWRMLVIMQGGSRRK